MKGQITTGSFYFRFKVRNIWRNAPVVKGVIVTVNDKGALVDPEGSKRRALRQILKRSFETNCNNYELINYKLSGLNLGKTAYNIEAPARSRPWEN